MGYLFTDRILQRGYSYYYSSAVEDLAVTDDTIKANVIGTEEYEVEIHYNKNKIIDMDCTCPYAQDGNNCKHMVAVLLEWENNYDEENPQEYKNIEEFGTELTSKSKEEVKELLNQASEQQIHDFLFDVLSSDNKLYTRFKTLIKQELSVSDIQSYKREIDVALHSYLNRDRYVSYYEADDFFNTLNDYIHIDFCQLMETKQYKTMFELSIYLCNIVSSIDIDDSDGNMLYFLENCISLWKDILEYGSAEVKDIMYKGFIQCLGNDEDEYMGDHLLDFVMNNFYEEKYLLDKLQYMQRKIKESNTDSWYAKYQMKKWTSLLLRIMLDLRYSKAEIKEYCRKYWEFSDLRKYYISECIEQQNYEEAINVLHESIKMDADYPGLVKEYRVQLKNVYQKIGNMRAYKDELWNLVTHNVRDIEYFRELKSIYNEEEWKSIREKLFALLGNQSDIDYLYVEEKMCDKLLLYVLDKTGFAALERHTDTLKNLYPRELLQKYRTELEKMASNASNRRDYQRLVFILRLMRRIKGGDEVIQDIKNKWQIMYKGRPAMMDELRRI